MTREPAGEEPRDRIAAAYDRAPYVSAAVQHATPERMAALALLVLIVWWTWPRKTKDDE